MTDQRPPPSLTLTILVVVVFLLLAVPFCAYIFVGYEPYEMWHAIGQFVDAMYRAAGGQHQR